MDIAKKQAFWPEMKNSIWHSPGTLTFCRGESTCFDLEIFGRLPMLGLNPALLSNYIAVMGCPPLSVTHNDGLHIDCLMSLSDYSHRTDIAKKCIVTLKNNFMHFLACHNSPFILMS